MKTKANQRNSAEDDLSDPVDDWQPLLARLCRISENVVYFPVRHHSPTCAAMVEQLIAQLNPSAVLIEGPDDYNAYLNELHLDHQLPIAIYSYFQRVDGTSSGAYYPFCEYSPEWVALQAAKERGLSMQFIDLPWIHTADGDRTTHRYADAELRRGRYVRVLCERMEVDDFDDLWDKLIESRQDITIEEYLHRVHSLCFHIRLWEASVSRADRQREAFMAEQIRVAALSANGGQILVVTGGFHSSALAARLEGYVCPGIDDNETFAPDEGTHAEVSDTNITVPKVSDAAPTAAGISLTTYSYERLDNLTGYNAGMPCPGFYEHVWRQRKSGHPYSHHSLLTSLVDALRKQRQTLSTADLIAVETSARGLAAIRGRDHVWRRDLIDAVTSSLIKDELEYGARSPFLTAVYDVLRGRRRGQLAAGTRMPPLQRDIQNQLADADLVPKRALQSVELNLLEPRDLPRSQLLHKLKILGISGFKYVGGTDFLKRDDLTKLWEDWEFRWTPEFESTGIEASRYGATLDEAATSRMQEIAREHPHSASVAAELLLQAAQAGISAVSDTLLPELSQLIAHEADFCEAASALGHVLFLYYLDESFGTKSQPQLGQVLCLAFERSLWLLELTGRTVASDRRTLTGMKTIFDAFQRTSDVLQLNAGEFHAILNRIEQDAHKPPQVRGAAAGILWTLGVADAEQVLSSLLLLTDPNCIGDFLTGLFALAREVAQRHPQFVQTIDRLLLEFSADSFQQALPSLRLAFTWFTPREKHYMLSTLFEFLNVKQIPALEEAKVDVATAAAALALDESIFEAIRRYGLEG